MTQETESLNQEELESTKNEETAVIVDFWADWCGACKKMEPVFEDMAEEHGEDIFFGKVNVDDSREAASEYQVSSIPTILFFKDGELADRVVGALPKDQFEEKIKEIFE